jgi:NADH:ubiquinone reductase (H+-translocating)
MMNNNDQRQPEPDRHHVVIVGGGFGGLYAAQSLQKAPVRVTLIDKRNFHLFQPLLYQVATGGLSPADIASPLRAVLKRARNTRVIKAEVADIDPDRQEVILRDGRVQYDSLILAAGNGYHYFGRDEWAENAPSLKTIEDAVDIRRRLLLAFEAAEREPDPAKRQAWLTFVIVGGGPTGVELAGALGELANSTLKDEFRAIDPAQARIILVEGLDQILPTYPADLAAKARQSLDRLNVNVRTHTLLSDMVDGGVILRDTERDEQSFLPARTVLWAAGVQASPLGQALAERAGAELDRTGRVMVRPDLSLPGYPNILTIGDLAHYPGPDGRPLPGVAQVAMQQGRYAAELIQARLKGQSRPSFVYKDKGNLAVIGRNAAVADLGRARFTGFLAWLIWVFVHIGYLIEFDNKMVVLLQWAWNYFTRKRGARLITGDDPFPLIEEPQDDGWAWPTAEALAARRQGSAVEEPAER